MMRKVLNITLTALLFIPLFIGTEKASAASPSGQVVNTPTELSKKEAFKQHVLENLKDDYPNAQFLDKNTREDELYQKQEMISGVNITASAPPLTSLEVYAAISSNYPEYEYFSSNQLSSVQDHGGEELYIVTAELGYGFQRNAAFNGRQLSEIDRENIDLEGDSIVDGWFIWWDASGNENGLFTYENTSTNSPWNTMFDRMNIK
ncbi:DUF4879 domain-containing protein [Sediminibacillus dalangtanensis]|uniref:DUF4879 domain-containing protein n=1 Tax=Sediminibacillus dalangtanensis TaxID=2729421 RepID=A0ABX7VSE9_9BACI|nr:DUF4879 domain-containing protein [Sediminibacillus dalangtanensis]QTM99571.1 DUF4879 domain-containing protein [Sediminibacillus dalangtanensis]